jgi:iron complex outermembrane receptor protein
LTDTFTVDFRGRYVDKLRAIYSGDIVDAAYPVDDYFTVDLQLRYSPSQDLEIALIGQNLLQHSHEEYVQEYYALPAEIERGVYMKATYRF